MTERTVKRSLQPGTHVVAVRDGIPAQIVAASFLMGVGGGAYRVRTSAGTNETWNNAEFFVPEVEE